jgi:hypothetical protein
VLRSGIKLSMNILYLIIIIYRIDINMDSIGFVAVNIGTIPGEQSKVGCSLHW